jgi:NifU-like protein involved in Fe-S cluster formation
MPSPKDPIKRAEWIKKFSDKLRGKPKSEKHRRKISEAHLGCSSDNGIPVCASLILLHVSFDTKEEVIAFFSSGGAATPERYR